MRRGLGRGIIHGLAVSIPLWVLIIWWVFHGR